MPSNIVASIDLSHYRLSREIAHLNTLPKIQEEYDEFAQGTWKNTSLLNASGDSADTQFRYCTFPFPTKDLQQLPEIQRLISENFIPHALKMVRARNLIDGIVVPHRDFIEMKDSRHHFFRVFLMLEDNPQAFHSDSQGVFHMKRGEVWFLDAAIDHSAVNFSASSRLALCLDFIFDTSFNPNDIFLRKAKKGSGTPTFIDRKPLAASEKEAIIDGIATLISRETFKDIFFALSKLHFIWNIPVAASYDWLIEAAQRAGNQSILDKARELKRYLIVDRGLGERFSITEWSNR